MDGTSIAEAQTAVADAIVTASAQARETADDEVERVLDAAQAALSEEQRNSERIAQAAMQSHLAQQFDAFKQEIRTWLDQQNPKVETLVSEMAEVKGQISSLALLQVSPPLVTSSSIPQPSAQEKVQEAVETVAEVLPESLSESAVEENPVQPTRTKTRRWI